MGEFGKYQLIDKIGTGGMAEVFLAKSFGAEGLEKILVIKRILPEFSHNPRFVDMFIAEAKIAVDLNHPNIVQIYDFGKHEDTYFLAMEYVDGADLGHLMSAAQRAQRPIPLGDALFLGAEIAKGLHYAHEKHDRAGVALDIVHRDISPQNVLVSQDGTVKIVDFGIAKATLVSDQYPEKVRGKFAYMSPEQAAGREVDRRSDIFSLGIVLFELLCGRQLFKAASQDEMLSLAKSAVVPDIASLNPSLPAEVVDLLYRMLAVEPDDRPATARAAQHELMRQIFAFEQLHDAGTLGQYFRTIEPAIDPTSHDGYAATGTGHTSMARTVTGGTMEVDRSTPVTKIVDDSPTGYEIRARERKEVVIVAGELQGLFDLRTSVGQDKWLQVLQSYTRIVDSVAYKSEAVVHRVNEDGFVLLFGIPVSSENDAELAVRVTLDLHEAVASLEYPIQLSAGIAIGDVVLEQEVDKTGRRFTWSFFGRGHELAERLAYAGMAREVLVGGQVFRRVRRRYDLEPVERIEHPDDELAQPVQAYLLSGPKSGQDALVELKRSYHTFHGRALPLKLLRELYRTTVLDRTAKLVLVLGRQGIGKSTLVEEFLRGLDARNVRIVRRVVGLHHRDVPLGSMASFLADILRLGSQNDLRQVRNTLTTRISALFPEEPRAEQELLLQSLGGLFNIKWANAAFDQFTGDERRDRIFLSLTKLLTRFAEKKPILLALDDAHNIDTMTLQFITQFFEASTPAPAMLIFTADDSGEIGELPAWQALLAARNVTVERLHELSPLESAALIDDLLRLHRIDDDTFAREILQRSGGNPLYIKEVVEVLRDRGMLRTDTGSRRSLKARDSAPTWLPANVEGLIRARIDRLPLHLKVVLQRVAFLWSPFEGLDVHLVLPDEPHEELEELVERGLLDRVDTADGVQLTTYDPGQTPPNARQYAFCNTLTQDVAAASLLPDEATELHRRLAAHLVETAGDTHSRSVLIARHFEGAGEQDQSVAFYFQAADAALEQYGAAESLRLIDTVLDRITPQSKYYYGALEIRARALMEIGNATACRAALEELERVADARRDEGKAEDARRDESDDGEVRLARVYIQRAQFEFDQSDLRRAREYVAKTVELTAGKAQLELEQARVSIVEAMISLNEGRRDDAIARAEDAVQTFRKVGGEADDGIARALNLIGVAHRQAGRHHDALRAYEQALAHVQPEGTKTKVTAPQLRKVRRYLLINAGLALAYLGEFSEALRRYEAALEEVRALGHRTEEANLLVNIGHCHLLRGGYDDAQSAIRRGIYLARKSGALQTLADGLISIGAVYVEQGDAAKAQHSLHEGLRLADSIPNVYLSVHATLQLALVHLAAATADGARIALVQAEDALERSQQAEMTWGISFSHSLMARALKILGRRDEALTHSRRAIELVNDGELFSIEEILYHHTQILPDDAAHEDDRRQAILRAREVAIHRRDRIDSEEFRRAYLSKPHIRQIFAVAKLLLEP